MSSKFISPLRYPGGKQKALSQISPYLPQNFQEYREPFVGGGAVFFHILKQNPTMNCWVNDLNSELYYFWEQVKNNLPELVEGVRKLKSSYTNGKELFKFLANADTSSMSALERGVRFFVLNRSSFSGTVDSGGYSASAFQGRFTDSSIKRLANLNGCFTNTRISNLDYSALLNAPGEDVFIYLDPPYLSQAKSLLYGKKGDLHIFDHPRFASLMSECPHKWLITYDDCQQVRDLFNFAQIHEWQFQYSMNKQRNKGKELLITNVN